MAKEIIIAGAGLAGATAAALLKDRYSVTVYDPDGIGGLCKDSQGYQERGPHAFHTDDEEVWKWLQRWAIWDAFTLQVYAYSDQRVTRLPRRQGEDNIFSVYSRKAWGNINIPQSTVNRVIGVDPEQPGYHSGKYKAQPRGGYSRMIERMLDGVTVVKDECKGYIHETIFTGNLFMLSKNLSAISRTWTHAPGTLKYPAINYCVEEVPQIRSWDNHQFSTHYRHIISSEFFGGLTPCYPTPGQDKEAKRLILEMKQCGIFCCGRMGTHQYLDMDATIRNVMDTIKEAGL